MLSSGAADAASALSARAADEVTSATGEAAATTADSTGSSAVQAAASRSDGVDPSKSESCLIGGQSFTANTKVLTASGALVAISKLKPGDKVLATNTATGKTQAEPVGAVLVHYDKDLYDLNVRAAGHTSVIHSTSNHLFWNQTTHHWTKAGALKYGTHLRTPSGRPATVVGGWTPRVTTGWMWDLTILTDHDFYVEVAGVQGIGAGEGKAVTTTDTSILVHNCGSSEKIDYDSTQLSSRAFEIRQASGFQEAEHNVAVASVQGSDGSTRLVSGVSSEAGHAAMALS